MVRKLCFSMLLLLTPLGCVAEVGQNAMACSHDEKRAAFLSENSDWSVNFTENKFFPIDGLKVRDGKVWVKSYMADYFPVKLSIDLNHLEIKNVVFRAQLPVNKNDDPALKVKAYKAEGVKFILSFDNSSVSCKADDIVKVTIVRGDVCEEIRFYNEKS